MTIGIGHNFGEGTEADSQIQPPALATNGHLERYLSEIGIRSWTNHDETNDGSLSLDVEENAKVLNDCKVYAGSLLAGRLSQRYEYSILATAPMCVEFWCVLVLRTLCFRRGNPPPASLEFRYQEIMQKDGLLDQIAKGCLQLTDVNGNPVRFKNSNTPSHANLQVDRRFPESQVRVVTGSSDLSRSKLGRKYDRYSDLE